MVIIPAFSFIFFDDWHNFRQFFHCNKYCCRIGQNMEGILLNKLDKLQLRFLYWWHTFPIYLTFHNYCNDFWFPTLTNLISVTHQIFQTKKGIQRMFKKTSVWLCSFIFTYCCFFFDQFCADFNDWRWKQAWIGSPGLVKSHDRLTFLTIEQMLLRISWMHLWLTCFTFQFWKYKQSSLALIKY